MDKKQSADIAFVGAGNHATQSLYPNIGQIPEFNLAAICDLDKEKARDAGRRFGATAWFTDVETMLKQVKPQGVCICGPAEMHYQVGLQVLRRGLPIFIEKPPGLTLEQARELADTAAANRTWALSKPGCGPGKSSLCRPKTGSSYAGKPLPARSARSSSPLPSIHSAG